MPYVKGSVSREYDSFPDESPPSPPKLTRTGEGDYGKVDELTLNYYGIDVPSYKNFSKITSKKARKSIYNKLVRHWYHTHNTAGKVRKEKKTKKVTSSKTRSKTRSKN